MQQTRRAQVVLALAALCLAVACALPGRGLPGRQGWWSGDGPVLPHDSFPGDCGLCHAGSAWQSVRADFTFDHAVETGVPLHGAHERARCLRCHNDRGPVAVFQAQGCIGCHEDVHLGRLGAGCEDCHDQETWWPVGGVELHLRTRFPLTGTHTSVSCRRCHPGAEVGVFVPNDVQCLTCHQADLARANNPNHLGLGWVDGCDRCHLPTDWNQAEID